MKKTRKKQGKARKQAPAPQAAAPSAGPDPDRRRVLRLMRNGAIALPVLGAAGFYSVRAVEASVCELDLTKIGTGVPSVVQVHDPNCSLCRTLQRQTRRALRAYDADGFHYLVANINTVEGNDLARAHGAPHVTLLFFDGAGELQGTLSGPVNDDVVRNSIAAHLGAA
ncbi:MAG: hypothetical protein AAF825_12285 [Pseudomonadota bacterium]